MARCAEIIYVAGPQTGQRIALMTNPVSAGRASDCDIHLLEECISRKAFTLTLTRDGWIFENLTPRKMEVSGGKYKAGKHVLLDTGDVICPGMETELLFVAADADPEAALSAYRKAHPEDQPAGAEEILPADKPADKSAGGPPPLPVLKAQPVSAETSLGGGAEVAQKTNDPALLAKMQATEKAAKRKKYLVGFLVYLVVLAGAVTVIKTLSGPEGSGGGGDGVPAELKLKQIQDAVNQSYRDFFIQQKKDPTALDPGKSDECLKLALGLWKSHGERIDRPYAAVKNFKLHLVYSGALRPASVEHENDFTAACNFVVERLWRLHQEAIRYENAGKWKQAQAVLDDMKRMLAACTERDPEYLILENTESHLAYVRTRIAKAKGKGF